MPNDIPLGDLTTRLKIGYDKTQAADIEASFRRIQEHLTKTNQHLGTGAKLMQALDRSAGAVATAFQNIGQAVEQFGQKLNSAISAGAAATAQLKGQIDAAGAAYRQAAGNAEQASRDWAAANLQVEQGYIAIGRVITQQTLPGMRLQAALLTDIANAAKNNPQITGAVSGVAGALQTAHGAGQAVGGGALGGIVGAGVLGLSALGAGANATKDQTGILGAIHDALQGGFNAVVNQIARVAPETANSLRGMVGGGAETAGGKTKAPSGAEQLASSPNQAQALAAQISYSRAVVANEIHLGDQRVAALIQMGRQILQHELQNSRTTEDQKIQRGRSEAQQALSQGRQLQDLFKQNDRQRTQESVNFFHQQLVASQDFHRQQGLEVRDFQRQQSRQSRDFNIQTTREDAAYQYTQSKAALQFQIEQTNASHNFYTQQSRNAEDHQFRLLDFASTRDALGIYKENRNYNVQKQRNQEDFSYQQGQSNQQRQITLKDEKYQFDLQRTYRLADFARQQTDQKQDLAWRQQQEKDDFDYRAKQEAAALKFQRDQENVQFGYQLDDMKTAQGRFREDLKTQEGYQHDDMVLAQQRFGADLMTQFGYQDQDMKISEGLFRRDLNTQLAYQLLDLSDHIGLTKGQWDTFYGGQVKQLSVFIDDMHARAAGPAAQLAFESALTDIQRAYIGLAPLGAGAGGGSHGGHHASGGYFGELGPEFVMRSDTTKAAESAIGGRLTQEAVLGSLRGGVGFGGGMALTLNQNFTFNGSLSDSEKQWFRRTARDEAVGALTTAVRSVTAARKR